MKNNRCKVPQTEPCGTSDVSFYDLLVFEVQVLEGFTKDFDVFKPLSLGIQEQRHKYDVILDSYFQLYNRILISTG